MVEEKFSTKLGKFCNNSPNGTIRIKDLTNFSWDKMYFFPHSATSDVVDKELGAYFPGYEENADKIVFLKDGKIIYWEELPVSVENAVDGQLVFPVPENKKFAVFTPQNSVFTVVHTKFSEGVYFDLIQIVPDSKPLTTTPK